MRQIKLIKRGFARLAQLPCTDERQNKKDQEELLIGML